MQVLVLNCGSSSVKFRVADATAARATTLASGVIERVDDHEAAVREAIGRARAGRGVTRIDAVGHRVVHGGPRFAGAAPIDDDVVAAIEALNPLAPLHNAPSLAGIRAARAALPGVPMVAAFDTAFHATMPARAAGYAIPRDLAARHGVRRFGFHGLAYRSVVAGWTRASGARVASSRLVALHLGSGCSAAAIEGGRSVDTSMGFTPLEGLVMGTRSGDVDPAIVPYLGARDGATAGEVVALLNQRSGLLGVSGTSADMRDLLAREGHDADARLAVEMFCHRVRKYLGAYLAVLGGADAVLFSGGIGEHQAAVRERVCAGFEWCGLVLDRARNAAAGDGARRISADGARLAAWVVPADEESVIVEDVVACLGGGPAR